MPKRLSDITHAFERSAADLEEAQDALTILIEGARARVEMASKAHRMMSSELVSYLKAHPDEIVIANDHGYHYDPSQPGSIRRRPIYWAHHVWVEDPEPKPEPHTYRVPRDPSPEMIAAWELGESDGEPIPAEACTE